MTRTFVDSGVLIAAARGTDRTSPAAFSILNDPGRQFASTLLVKLETIPKATYLKRRAEREFYEIFFDRVSAWALFDSHLAEIALAAACDADLSAIDSLHIAAAYQTRCEEFVTTEKLTKPLHRTTLVKIRSIQP
jgi:predicted nucleic acid-binding protein